MNEEDSQKISQAVPAIAHTAAEVKALTAAAESELAAVARLAAAGRPIAVWKCGGSRTVTPSGKPVKCGQELARVLETPPALLLEVVFRDQIGERRTHLWVFRQPKGLDPWAIGAMGDRVGLRCPNHGLAWLAKDDIEVAISDQRGSKRFRALWVVCGPGGKASLRAALSEDRPPLALRSVIGESAFPPPEAGT